MTQRERFLRTMGWGHPGRPPLWEEGVQEETLARWREQGMPEDAAPEELFRFDRREMVEVNLGPRPAFRHDDSADSFARLQGCYRSGDSQRLPTDWACRVEEWCRRDYPLGMGVGRGLLQSLGIEDWSTLERVLCALAEEPVAVEATMERVTELSLWLLERVLGEVTLDFALFNEPIASFHAPIVSPAHFRRFALPNYRRLVKRLHAAHVPTIIVQTYGQVEPLVPLWLEAGINTLWCSHAGQAQVDLLGLRHRYGKELRLIGGIPAMALLQGRAAIDEALGTIAPLLAQGGYLPMVDDRVRSNVPYDHYRYYRQRLAELVEGAEERETRG